MTEAPIHDSAPADPLLRRQAAQQADALGRLTTAIAHDLSNILAVIGGNIELVLQDKRSRPIRPELTEVRQAAELGADLVRQLLDFSRPSSTTAEIIDVNATLLQFHRILTRLVGRQIEVDLDLGGESRFVSLGPGLLEQVIMNLGLNARDAMPWGGRLRVAVGRAANDDVQIEVSDTGVGISQHVRSRIFEPFFSTKEPGTGTGLGLSTVHDIVHHAGGRIEVDTALGAGTRVRVMLPSAPIRARD